MRQSWPHSKSAPGLEAIEAVELIEWEEDLTTDELAQRGLHWKPKNDRLSVILNDKSDLGVLRRFTYLDALHLYSVTRQPVVIDDLPELHNLRILSMKNCTIECKSPQQIAILLPNISVLNAMLCDISNDSFEVLTDAIGGSLESLDLYGTIIGDAGGAFLARCHRLVKLDLEITGVSDRSISSICRLASLKVITFRINGTISHAAAERLRSAIPDLRIEWGS